MMYVEFMKNFYLVDSNKLMAVRLISAFWAQKTFDSNFLDMVYVELMKNIRHSDSNEAMVVSRLFSGYSAKERLIPTF